jgi:hypothetical protein
MSLTDTETSEDMGSQRQPLFIHIEIVHHDPDAAAQFMRETLGATDVEPRTAAYIERMFPGMRLVHVMVGGVVFQFVKPGDNPELLPSWREQLERQGPSIHNVTIAVPSYEVVVEKMVERGGKVITDSEVDFTPAGYEHPPGIRAGTVDAREQTGIVFELLPTAMGWIPGKAP